MRNQRSDGCETRRRLRRAAGEIFAARGFREATLGEICAKARANVAAANYHFGGKESLYVAAWRQAFDDSLRRHPPDGGIPPGAPAEARLRGRILALMRRVSDPQSFAFDIVHKEMASPTGLLRSAVRESLQPLREAFASIVQELLGPRAAEAEVRLCRMSIVAQCLGPLLRQRRRRGAARPPGGGTDAFSGAQDGLLPEKGVGSGRRPKPWLEDIEGFADHVARFSLAGIREIRKGRKSPRNGKTRPFQVPGSRFQTNPNHQISIFKKNKGRP